MEAPGFKAVHPECKSVYSMEHMTGDDAGSGQGQAGDVPLPMQLDKIFTVRSTGIVET